MGPASESSGVPWGLLSAAYYSFISINTNNHLVTQDNFFLHLLMRRAESATPEATQQQQQRRSPWCQQACVTSVSECSSHSTPKVLPPAGTERKPARKEGSPPASRSFSKYSAICIEAFCQPKERGIVSVLQRTPRPEGLRNLSTVTQPAGAELVFQPTPL